MAQQLTHPSPAKLTAFGLGQLPLDEASVIERHITECEPCCETIIDLASDDTFIELLQKVQQAPGDQTTAHDGQTREQQPQTVPAPLAEHPRYEIVGLIGKGGMGDVYRARHRKMDRTVALKVINRELFRKSEAVDRFQREVKAAAQLSHPNIVTAHDADQAGDYHFMVMEYVDGIDLSEIVKQRGPLAVGDACDYIRQAALGLQHAHERGMVHRDVKPHNLMLTTTGDVKILDFGLASLAPAIATDEAIPATAGDLTVAGSLMGTPDFISPEQARDARQADIRSDIYSLGATLYFLLSGRAPFSEGSVLQKLKSHAEREPASLLALRDDIPAELQDIVAKMMAKNPDERFQTPDAVATALDQISKAHKPASQPLRRRVRRLPLVAVASTLLAAIFAATIFYVATDNGTVRVQVKDESLAVQLNGQTISFADGDKKFKIGAGANNKLVVSQEGTDFRLETSSFEVNRNGEVAIAVELLDGKVVVTKDGESFDSESLPAPAAAESLKGQWIQAALSHGGRSIPLTDAGSTTLTLDANSYTITVRSADGGLLKSRSGTFTIDATKSPMTCDFIDDNRAGDEMNGIFAIDGDTLKFCLLKRESKDDALSRPTELASPAGSEIILWEFRRAGSSNDQQKIQGTWQVTYSEDSGRIAPQEMLKNLRFVIDGQTLTTEMAGQKSVSQYKLDPSSSPKSIDLTEAGRTKQGIYDLTGDTLRICFAEDVEQRPTAFDSQPGSANDVIIMLKRKDLANPNL